MFKSLMKMFKKDEPQEDATVTVEPVSDVVKVEPKREAPKPLHSIQSHLALLG